MKMMSYPWEAFPWAANQDRVKPTAVWNSTLPICPAMPERPVMDATSDFGNMSEPSVYTLGSDMFPKSDVASITGLSGMAGQIGSVLFQTAVGFTLSWFAAQGNASHGYDIIFMVCGSAYLAAFVIFSLIIPNINMVAPRER